MRQTSQDWKKLYQCQQPKRKVCGRPQSSTYPKATKQYTTDHGALHGGSSPGCNSNLGQKDVPLDLASIDEGLYTLVQTVACQ